MCVRICVVCVCVCVCGVVCVCVCVLIYVRPYELQYHTQRVSRVIWEGCNFSIAQCCVLENVQVNNRFGIYKRNGQGDCNLDGVRVALFENPDESIRQASARFLIMVLRHDYTYTVAGSTSDRTLAHPDPCEEPLHAAALSWQLLGNRGFTRLPQIPGLYNWLDRESERAKARAFRAIRTGAELPEPVAKCAVSAVRNAEQASNGCANSVAEISSNNGSMESQNTEKELRDSNDDAADDSDDDDDDDAAALQLAMQMSMADEAHGDLRVETQSSNTGIGTSPTSVSVGVDGGHAHPMQKADEEEKPVACPLTGEHQMRVLPVSMMLLDAILSSTTLGLVLQHPDRSRQFFHFALDATGVASIPKVKTAETAKSQPPTGCHSADQATMATSGIENGTQRFASFSRAARLAASANGFLPALLQVLGRDFAGQQGMHVFLSIVAEPRSPATKEAGTGHIAPEQERVAQAIRCEGVGLPPAGIARSLPMMSLRYSPGYPSLNPLVPLLRQSHYRSQVPWCCVLQLVASLVTEEPLWKCIYVQLCRLRVPTQNEAPPQLEVGKGSTHARVGQVAWPVSSLGTVSCAAFDQCVCVRGVCCGIYWCRRLSRQCNLVFTSIWFRSRSTRNYCKRWPGMLCLCLLNTK